MIRRLVLALALVAGVAAADPSPEAKPHVDAGVRAYSAAEYDTAAREFELAYEIDADPALLYAWAQARRQGGRCADAIDLYRRYLETKPTADQTTAANTGITLCEQQLQQQQQPLPPERTDPTPPPSGPPTREAPPAAVTVDRPWYRDKLGAGLVGGGAVATALGVTFLVLAKRSADAASDADTRSDFLDHRDDALSRRRIGYIGLGVGAALVGAGVLRFVLRDDDDGSATVAITGTSIGVAGRF